jgi:hypothetical protein
MVENVKVGEVYYIINNYDGEVQELKIEEHIPAKNNQREYWNGDVLNTPYHQGAYKEMLFKTKEEAIRHRKAEKEKDLNNLRKAVETPEKTLEFLFNNFKHDEYNTDKKNNIVKEKIRDHFGIELN